MQTTGTTGPTGPNRTAASQIVAASGVNLLAGIWLIIAPFLLGYSDQAAPLWNDIIVGIIVALFGIWSAVSSPRTTAV